jgi:hypothetical protein
MGVVSKTRRRRTDIQPPEGDLTASLQAAVADYIRYSRPGATKELDSFRDSDRTDEDAVGQAALAQLDGKRHPHQRRIPRASLEESRKRLLRNLPRIRAAQSFDQLFDLIAALISPIRNIGELTLYDTALRIGARFDVQPERVYLHAGTREGAAALGFDRRRATIEMRELPRPIRRLSAREAEDFLCAYKPEIAAAMAGGTAPASKRC